MYPFCLPIGKKACSRTQTKDSSRKGIEIAMALAGLKHANGLVNTVVRGKVAI